MKNDKQNIAGIYNYCDRWCERCTFTRRCAVYEDVENVSPAERDIQNEAFWNRISDSFKEAAYLLQKAAEEHGIDLNTASPDEEENYHRQRTKKREAAENHPIGKLSMQYTEDAERWLTDKQALDEKGRELIGHFNLGIQNEEQIQQTLKAIKDCLEVIKWYQLFIHVKFMRALQGKARDDNWEEENGFPKDSDGSAKIALIATERSMQAWTELYRLIPEEEDNILMFLAQLQKIIALAEKEFPDARKFVRPGFDE